MDLRHNVNDTDDFERHSPPLEQLQHSNDAFFPGLGDTSEFENELFNPAYSYGHDGIDMIYTGPAANTQGMAQETSSMDMLHAFDGVTLTNPHVNNASRGGFGFHDAHDTAVNGYEDPNLYDNLLHDLDIPDGEQTFNAPDNFTNPYLQHQHLPQFGSGDLADRLFPDFAFNSPGHPANTAPLPTHTSQAFTSPAMDEHTTQAILPPLSPHVESSKRPRRRRHASTGSRDTPEASRLKKQCAGCHKAFYTSKDPEGLRCTRCYDKHVKHTAGHTTYIFDPEMTIEDAWKRLYPTIQPLAAAGDDVEAGKANEQDYVRRLIEAVSIPYTSDESGSKENHQRVAQQAKLNKKPYDSTQYRNDLVNARIRFLFKIALSYHDGGPSLYDLGGDNSGYGEDRTMKFSERIERIIQLLRFDKDIAMDVIEGRGVTALVHNPNKYERRKRDNKKSNDTKQDLQEKGKQLHMLEAGASASPAPLSAPLLGPQAGLQAQLSGGHGDFGYDRGASAPAHSPLQGLPVLGSRAGLPSEGGGENNAASAHLADLADLDGYLPARFG